MARRSQTLVAENSIQPNLLRNWKKEFLNNASLCSMTIVENLKEKLAENGKRKRRMPRKSVLTMGVNGQPWNPASFADLIR